MSVSCVFKEEELDFLGDLARVNSNQPACQATSKRSGGVPE